MHSFADRLRFLAEFLRSPRMIGSMVPSSPFLIDSVLARVNWAAVDLFVEYGPGMGTFTVPVLHRLKPGARLIAIDTNPRFVDHLKRTIADPRFDAVLGSAESVEHILAERAEGRRADCILSGLPLSTLPDGVGDAIVAATHRALGPGGTFLVYQYSGLFLPLLKPYFGAISKGWEWRNIPPCLISTARK